MMAIRVHAATDELGKSGWYVQATAGLAAFVTDEGSELRIVSDPGRDITLGDVTPPAGVPYAARALIEAFLRAAAFRPMT